MSLRPPDFEFVRDLVWRESAIVLGNEKDYLVKARLTSLARVQGFGSLERFMYEVRNSPSSDLRFRVVEAMTTNETSFFRDSVPFDVLREHLLPKLIQERQAERRLRIWSAGCSSGQELYSVAMLIDRHFPELGNWEVELLGTDISAEMIKRAKQATYTPLEIARGLGDDYRKYLVAAGRGFQIADTIRRRPRFLQLNLVEDWPDMGVFDVILLRNVLIYFDVAHKAAVLSKTQQRLRPGGYLFLGGTETTLNLHCGFQRVLADSANCYQLREAT